MKKNNFKFFRILLLLFVAIAVSCTEEEPEDFVNNENTDYYGNWKRDGVETWVNFSGSTATTCNNGVQTVGTFDSSEPSMTFVIQGETITFPLEFNGDTMWMGVPDQAVDTNVAARYTRTSTFCDGSGGGGGDGDGNITFWIQSDFECGNISVTLQGQGSSTISAYYGSSPDCGASGCANFTVPAGSYSFSASCDGRTWEGSLTVSENQCFKMQLTI
jgi:hypothetical protein